MIDPRNSMLLCYMVLGDMFISFASPGQALSYKMGQLKILELRAKAERELGKKFDVKQFHSQVLDTGSLPLSTLEEKINSWIASIKGL